MGAFSFQIERKIKPGITLESLIIFFEFKGCLVAVLLADSVEVTEGSRKVVDLFVLVKLHLQVFIVRHGFLGQQLRQLAGPEHVHARHLLVSLLRRDLREVAEVRLIFVRVFAYPKSLHLISVDAVAEEERAD